MSKQIGEINYGDDEEIHSDKLNDTGNPCIEYKLINIGDSEEDKDVRLKAAGDRKSEFKT